MNAEDKPVHFPLIHLPVFASLRPVAALSDASFESFRIYAIIVFCLLRLFLVRRYLQSYLNSAYQR